ncbi:MAG: SurA N-terminal domain-containing protein, partial [Candidatus Zixiibacteriota bacterium]
MKTRIISLLVIFYFLFLPSIIFAQESLDQIAAIVGKDIILESELKTQLEFYLTQTGKKVENPEELNKLRKTLLDQMINDRLLLAKAEKDTLLKINEKEIEQTLEDQLSKIKSQFSSEEAFQKELKTEGLTEAELKRNYREQIKEQILRDKLISSKLSKANISSREVKEFYQSYKDS